MTDIQAHSDTTGKTYENWDQLIEAEANGWLMVVIITNTKSGQVWPWIVGPMTTRKEAERKRANTRTKWKRDQDNGRYLHLSYQFFVRPAWKADAR